MRALIVTLMAIFLILFAGTIYRAYFSPENTKLPPLPPNLLLIGVIDMSGDHGIHIQEIRNGNDVLLTLDYPRFYNTFVPTHPEFRNFYNKSFDIMYYDSGTGILDRENPLWPYLYIVTFSNNGASYQIKRLEAAGIRAIPLKHISPEGNHTVILTDGDTRILYEIRGTV